ncbi:histone-lysine N-methyltransferase 2A-like [Scleropages formosus]|uniref:histone-lysine N-methyltransferase 2A-like n=1 Tax=Scleropages formosus TaxID=113540 RepID=UPI0010FA9664|nr:histone-lysine N-methyltransferase 2A-like [Scleropages formosus]
MTVDCLGMLKQLSECEGKLFPIGYQCSRVYWSTADAQKRSLYTCKILTRPPLFGEHESKSTAKLKESKTLSSSHFSDSGDLSSLAPEEIIVGLPRSTLSSPLLPVASQDLWPKVPKKQKMSSVEDQNCKISSSSSKDRSKILVVKVDGTQNSTSSLVKTETLTCARALPAPVALVRTSKLKKTNCRMEEARERNRDTNTSAAFGTKTTSSSKFRIVKHSFQVENKTSKLRVSSALTPTNVPSSGSKPGIPSSDTTAVFHTSAKQDILRSSKSQFFPSTSMGSEKSELNSQQSTLENSFTHENKGIAINNCDSIVLSKRRYPHRSTRAHANMFGHKPFCNVGSYTEKGVPLYHRKNDTSSLRGTKSKSSAKGQVDAMACVSTSSSGESGEEEGSEMNRNTEAHYYNFTRTTVSSKTGALSTGEIALCSIKEPQAKTMRKGREKKATKEGSVLTGCPHNLRITQLDGIDDGSESDASVSTSSIPKNDSNRRKVRECQIDATKTDSGKGVENSTGIRENSSGSAHESRRNRREACLPSEVQSSISTDLLNIGSDDCSNILPSDIMEFVLNTPSLQALGQQEASSSELVCLEEGFGLQADQGKDIGLFEDFAQPVSVESGTRVSGEEQYSLPLVLPSDLSVLTTTCPSVNEPKHGGLILKHNVASTSPRDLTVSKGIVKQGGGNEGSAEDQHSGNRTEDLSVKEGQPKPLTKDLMEANSIAFPPLSQAMEPETKDLKKTSVMSSSPSMPLQMQKVTPVPMEIQDPLQAASIAAHLTPSQENVIVLNQPLQPLYLVHSLPNGGTQKIQIVAPVSTTGGIDANLSALNSMTGKLETTAGLNTGITATQAMFSPTLNGAVLQAFTDPKQTNLQPGLSHTSGFLPGVQSHNSNIMGTVSGFDMTSVSSASSPSSMVLTSGHGTKRPISRLQPRKIKKLSRSSNKLSLAPSDVRSRRTLVNVLPSQMAPGLVQLGTLTTAASTSHQKVSHLVKWPKPGYVYLEPATAVLSQGMSLSSGQPSCIGQENQTPLLPCTVSGLNVVSVPGRAPSSIVGPDPLNTQEPQIVLQSGTSQFISPLASHSQATVTNSICVLSTHQVLGVNQFTDHENMSCLEHQSVTQVELDRPHNLNASATTLGSIPVEQNLKSHGKNGNLVVFTSQNHQDSDRCQGRNKAAVNSTSETEKASGKKNNSCQEKERADIACSLSPSICDKTVSPEPVRTEGKTTSKSVTDEVESLEKCEVKVPTDPKTEEGWLSAPPVSISDGVHHRKALLQCEKSAKGDKFRRQVTFVVKVGKVKLQLLSMEVPHR